MIPTRTVLCGLAALLLVATSTSVGAATWQWRDAQGRMVYSDRPPPSEVRSSQILRSPAPAPAAPAPREGASAASPAGEAVPADAPAERSAAAPPAPAPAMPSWVERERAFRERQAERRASEEKAREERENAEHAQRACDELQHAIRTLESGMVVVSINARGEREPMGDAERARRLERARAERERSCKGPLTPQ